MRSPDWESWGRRLAGRASPLPLRWDGIVPGVEGIEELDRPTALAAADSMVAEIAGWSVELPAPMALHVERLEELGDAWLLTGNRRYVEAFERAIDVYTQLVRRMLEGVTTPLAAVSAAHYYDYHMIRLSRMAYTYLNMRGAGLSAQTHAAVMKTILRTARFTAFNVRTVYNYGNHQAYESSGLATVAALFLEFAESDLWARVASRSIRLHLEREVYADGGYTERCGYHTVAMTFVMQSVATVRANGLEARFVDLMHSDTLATLERMHEWMLKMTMPDGTFPTFGDYGAYSQLRFLQRGAAIFRRADLAWPLQTLAPSLVPAGLKPTRPQGCSVSLESGFTVMRGGWDRDDFWMAVDHGPLGGQHSHIDTMGFIACAFGQPLALDAGVVVSYSDPQYTAWFRSMRAHNVVAIDGVEPEKVVERSGWHAGGHAEHLIMRSRGYEHALGVLHERKIVFIKAVGWLICDRLYSVSGKSLADRGIEWMFHSPFELQPAGAGILRGSLNGVGLMVLVGKPDEAGEPSLEKRLASVPMPDVAAMRQVDGRRQLGACYVRDISSAAWRMKPKDNVAEFTAFLLPYRGARPDASLVPEGTGWRLALAGNCDLVVDDACQVKKQDRGS